MKSVNRIVSLALFVAVAAVFTAALCVAYELGRIDGVAEEQQKLALVTREAVELPVVELPVLVTPLPYRAELPAEAPSEALVETPVDEPDSYREDVPLSPELQAVLQEACEETGVEYAVALGLIEVESDFDPECVSSCNCYGLMQLNPRYFPDNLDSADSIRVGMAYLADCIAQYNDLEAGLRAYNRGFDDGNRVYSRAVLEAAERWRGVLYGE